MGSLKGTISAEACPSLRLTANAGRRLGVKYQRAWQSLKVVPGSGNTVSNKEGGVLWAFPASKGGNFFYPQAASCFTSWFIGV